MSIKLIIDTKDIILQKGDKYIRFAKHNFLVNRNRLTVYRLQMEHHISVALGVSKEKARELWETCYQKLAFT